VREGCRGGSKDQWIDRECWSPRGLACDALRPTKHSEWWSVLPALTIEDYLDYIVFQGSITADLFVEFVEERVLPCCNPYPGPRSVLILDNASIHKDTHLKQLCDEAEVLLLFLPPYSPDINLIEATFKDLKAWIKWNYHLAEEFENFGDFLQFAVGQSCGSNVEGHFWEAGYVVGGIDYTD